MESSIIKKLYVEYTKEHFKLFAPIKKLKIFVNIYLSIKKSRPVIFNSLYGMYRRQGLNKIKAAEKAAETIDDFLTACENSKHPFKIKIFTNLQINNGKKEQQKNINRTKNGTIRDPKSCNGQSTRRYIGGTNIARSREELMTRYSMNGTIYKK